MENSFPSMIKPWQCFPLARITALGLLLTLALGCESSGPVTVPVHGKITFDGGPPPAPGNVDFAPEQSADGSPMAAGSAKFDEQGRFSVTTYREGDGLVPGTYRVNIECWREPPTPATMISASYVPAGFESPTLVIEAGTNGPVEVTYDVPLKR